MEGLNNSRCRSASMQNTGNLVSPCTKPGINRSQRSGMSIEVPIVMEDRGAAIAAGEDMIEAAWDVESWLAGHGEERSDWHTNKSLSMPDPNVLR
jgi:hypothetical protein